MHDPSRVLLFLDVDYLYRLCVHRAPNRTNSCYFRFDSRPLHCESSRESPPSTVSLRVLCLAFQFSCSVGVVSHPWTTCTAFGDDYLNSPGLSLHAEYCSFGATPSP